MNNNIYRSNGQKWTNTTTQKEETEKKNLFSIKGISSGLFSFL